MEINRFKYHVPMESGEIETISTILVTCPVCYDRNQRGDMIAGNGNLYCICGAFICTEKEYYDKKHEYTV